MKGPAIVAQLKCPSTVQFLTCDAKGMINALKFHTTSNEVNWNCTLSCGVEETEVVIAGKLIEEKKFEGKDETGTSRYSRNMFESPVESMVNGWNGLVDGLLMRIVPPCLSSSPNNITWSYLKIS